MLGSRPTRAVFLTVNESFQTAQPHIRAAGDVIGFPALASSSMEQARMAMVHAFDLKYKQQVAELMPYGIYTIPECSMVGETEDSAQRKGIALCRRTGSLPSTMPAAASSVTTPAS